MKFFRIIVLASLIVFGAGFAGCGGGTKVQNQTTTTTLGQELTDLKAAYDQGIITEKEYEKKKKELLKKK